MITIARAEEILDLDVFIECALRRKHSFPLISKIEEWKLTETKHLAMAVINRNSDVFFGSQDDPSIEQKVINNVVTLLLGLVFWDDFMDNEEDFPYLQSMVNITPDSAQLRNEAHTFLKNNLWMQPIILEVLRGIVNTLDKELDSMRRIYEKGKKLLS